MEYSGCLECLVWKSFRANSLDFTGLSSTGLEDWKLNLLKPDVQTEEQGQSMKHRFVSAQAKPFKGLRVHMTLQE